MATPLIPPLGFILHLVLYCHPNLEYKMDEWYEEETTAKLFKKVLLDGKWIKIDNKICIFTKAEIEKEIKQNG